MPALLGIAVVMLVLVSRAAGLTLAQVVRVSTLSGVLVRLAVLMPVGDLFIAC